MYQPGIEKVPAAQVNGSANTWSTRNNGTSTLDHILASAPVRARGFQTEVYNSALDTFSSGLPKPGPFPQTNASSLASDHYLIFGDFDLGGPQPAPVAHWPVASPIIAGQTLAESSLTGGSSPVPGTFAFALPSEMPPAGNIEREVTFTPYDTEGYAAVSQMVQVNVRAATGALFLAWSGGKAAQPGLIRAYAIGGAPGPDSHEALPLAMSIENDALSIRALVKTNDPALNITGESAESLPGAWSTQGVTVRGSADGVDQSDALPGCEMRIYSIPKSGSMQRFLRLRATLE